MPPTKSAWLDWHNLKPYSRRGKGEGQTMMASSVFKRKETTNATCMCIVATQAEITAAKNTQLLLARIHSGERSLADEKAKLADQRKMNSAILQELESSKTKIAHLEQSEERLFQQVAVTERRREDAQERLDSTIEEMDLLRDRIGELDTKHARIQDELDRVCSERDLLLQRPFYDSECVAQAEAKYAAMECRVREMETGDICVQRKLQAFKGFAFIVLSLLVSTARASAIPPFVNDQIPRICEMAVRLGIDLNSCTNLGRDGWTQGPTNNMAAAINEVDALSRLASSRQQGTFIQSIFDGGVYQAQLASTNGNGGGQCQVYTSDGSASPGYQNLTQANHFCETTALNTQPTFIGISVQEPLEPKVNSTPSSDSVPFGQQTPTDTQSNIGVSTTGATLSQGDEHMNAESSTGIVNNDSIPSQPQTITSTTRALPTANASRPRGVPVTAPPVNFSPTTTTTQPTPTEDKPPRKLTSDEEWMLAMGIDAKDLADLAKQQAKIEDRSHPEDRPIPAAKPA
ncbi:hypothetical protein CYLTODRAFT_492368 [Cylindrobasidium torrendii FP15055 ss-10]|uniref:Uncharacterized protein n=1 Tax=Cylindrobasidium torrendii FP15055 ss-10 TaxID=1314674 RepID=A0A0D7B5C9_9AGAR|nr:hypothetical protein CYLTODRAFT_492368 [Cylindrobasidium torrendii FP15055 ss-10]